ncbi:hypothetical protein JCM3766R1_002956 [Sporobolomyces carnicolor]
MEYADQYLTMPAQQPSFQLQPPTPITATTLEAAFVIPSASSMSSPVPIPPSSRPTSRCGTPASSLSRSASRHHPYGGSPASFASSFSDRSFRPRSATSASDLSEWESDASGYDMSAGSRFHNSPDMLEFANLDFPFIPDATLPSPPVLSSLYPSSHPSPTDSIQSSPRAKGGKNEKSKKSHARKTAPGHIKRPPNAFILFRSHCCGPRANPSEPDPPGTAHARHLASLDINNSQHVSLIVSQIWKGLKPDDKAYWEQKAKAAKEEHQRLYPDYRYKPRPRPKETMRKRKKADPVESQEHRDACHEVARIVLEQEGDGEPDFPQDLEPQLPIPPTPSTTGRGLMEEVIDGGGSRRTSPRQPRPTRRSNRKAKEPISDDSSPPSLGLPTPPALSDSFSHSANAPYPSVLATGGTTQFLGAVDPHSSPDYDNSPFAFMAQLDRDHAKSALPSHPLFAMDPKFSHLSSTIDGQAVHPLSRPATTSSPASFFTPASAPPATSDGFTRPTSPTADAIRQMQSYSINGPSPPSRPSTSLPLQASDYTFGTYSPQAAGNPPAPLAQRRDVHFPPNLPLSALKHRRSTLRASDGARANDRGDLMLISPLTSTFNGRRQSIGWSAGVRRVSLGLGGKDAGGPNPVNLPYRKSSLSTGVLADNASFETLTFPQDVIESFPVESAFTDAEFFAAFGSSTLPAADEEVECERPGTASSAWSTDDGDSIERLEGGFPAGYFDRRRSTLVASKFASPGSRVPEYHVDSTPFFSTPEHPLSSLGSQPPQPAVPAFGSAEFGGSFQPFEHRPSIGSLVASSLAAFDHNVGHPFSDAAKSNQCRRDEREWTAASVRDDALSLLQERRNPSGSPSVQATQPAECEYVLLPVEQLGDTDLMARLHEQGYGIAFETDALAQLPSQTSHDDARSFVPSGATMAFDDTEHFLSQSSH